LNKMLDYSILLQKIPFAIFIDLYNDHPTENYDYILSKFINIFDGLEDYKEYCMSFVFYSFIKEKVLHSCADRLCLAIFSSEILIIYGST
ncbi:hypothetical protein, partial [Candidatus Ichthyocystis sparus]|uniref:hypothetical protein n=1 Tax=Candidatus Ichthyocystis sparus TaxID=1561004 RepID=UPI001F5ECBD7